MRGQNPNKVGTLALDNQMPLELKKATWLISNQPKPERIH